MYLELIRNKEMASKEWLKEKLFGRFEFENEQKVLEYIEKVSSYQEAIRIYETRSNDYDFFESLCNKVILPIRMPESNLEKLNRTEIQIILPYLSINNIGALLLTNKVLRKKILETPWNNFPIVFNEKTESFFYCFTCFLSLYQSENIRKIKLVKVKMSFPIASIVEYLVTLFPNLDSLSFIECSFSDV